MPFDPTVQAAIAAAASSSGLADRRPAFMGRMAQIESSGDPNAYNRSGASGLYQFMPKTAQAYGLADPFDPAASAQAAARLTLDNEATLKRALGRDPTDGELYLAHQQGGGGASKLLANPDALAADLVGAKAVTANGGTAGMSARDFAGLWLGKFDGAGAKVMPGSIAGPGAFGLAGPTASGTPGSITPAGGAAMQAPERDSGPDVAALLKTLTGPDAAKAASPVAQAAAAPAPMVMRAIPRRQAPAFDALRFFALLPGAAATR